MMQIEKQSGHLVKLRCPVRGHPNNTNYRWFKNAKPLKGVFRDNGEKVGARHFAPIFQFSFH